MIPTYIRSITLDTETFYPLWIEEVPYDGEWELAKKGREAQQHITQTSQDIAKENRGRQAEQYGSANTDIGQEETQSAPGGLSPAASAQLALDRAKIQNTYENAKTQGLKGIAQHGMGTLTGEQSSLANSLLRGQASDENRAQEEAIINTQNLRQHAIAQRLGLQNLYSPVPALNTGSESAYRQAQMGSTLGDIGKGISTGATLASDIVGMGGLTNLPSNILYGKG